MLNLSHVYSQYSSEKSIQSGAHLYIHILASTLYTLNLFRELMLLVFSEGLFKIN